MLLPNGITAFRYADGKDLELESMILAADAIRPLCASPTDSQSQTLSETTTTPLTSGQLHVALSNNTFHRKKFHLYFRGDGYVFGKSLRSGAYDVGTWTITDDGHTCRTWNVWAQRRKRCYVVYRQEENYSFIQEDKWRNLVYRRQPGNPEGY